MGNKAVIERISGHDDTIFSKELLSLQDLQHWQVDVFSPSSLELRDLLLSIQPSSVSGDFQNKLAIIHDMIGSFNGSYTIDSSTPSVLEAFRTSLSKILRNKADSLATVLLGSNITAIRRPSFVQDQSLW